jgi:cell wall-associated NlpC family hydrolase
LSDWRIQVLKELSATTGIDYPVTEANLRNLGAWWRAEGGHSKNTAQWNWLNTTRRMPGSKVMPGGNSAGVQWFPDFRTGVRATVQTLNNGYYGSILAALRNGNVSLDEFARTVYSTPWGTKRGIDTGPASAAASRSAATVARTTTRGTPRRTRRTTARAGYAVDNQHDPLIQLAYRMDGLDPSFVETFVQLRRLSRRSLPRVPSPREAPADGRWVVDDAHAYVGSEERVTRALQGAKEQLGKPYVWAAASPESGFDCSGLIKYIASKYWGVDLPHYAASQYRMGEKVPQGKLRPGDAVFFNPKKDGPGHVGIYLGDDKFLHAPRRGDVVKISTLSSYPGTFMGARRYW